MLVDAGKPVVAAGLHGEVDNVASTGDDKMFCADQHLQTLSSQESHSYQT